MSAPLICKDCKYFSKGKNMSLCKRNDSWEITEPDNKCHFLPEMTELTCGDCWCLNHDMGCFGCSSGDSAYINGKLCGDFTDLRESMFIDILSFWKSRNIYDRNKIYKMIDDFEKDFDDLAGQLR